MAVVKVDIEALKNAVYYGLSTDVKPTPTAPGAWGERVGSIFYETDTGDRFIYDGTQWLRYISAVAQLTSDPMLDIASGTRFGHGQVNKFGASGDVADGVAEEIWDGAVPYVWPTTATIEKVRAAVDSVATRGMILNIQGVDANYDLTSVNTLLDPADSTTEVDIIANLLRVFRVKIIDSTVADQDIWVGPTGFASKQAVITAGNNQTLMALYTIPAGKTGYVTNYYASVIGDASAPAKIPNYVLFRLWERDNANGYAPQLKHETGAALIGTSNVGHDFKPYHKVEEKTDIWMEATPDGDDARVSAGFDIILVDNP